ncbi:hypothetical protein [Marinomonas profundimaris]|uniref:Uncharacterized protein n=1 Tax=Marinomonas profundimaris TaxID=1208321 RepID=W1RRI9_9GAMM|nr:hypothetical protein [Marinomonas profundimaris]ETI59557.1 hypothetical protein D104_12055 [Marinomonas profundimaris]
MKKLFFLRFYLVSLKFFRGIHCSRIDEAIVILSLIFIIALGYLITFTFPYLSSQSSLFNVDAKSEYISISPFEKARYPDWKLENVTVYDGCGGNSEILVGVLSINSVTTIELERIEKNDLSVTLNTPNFESTAKITSNAGLEKDLSDCATLVFDTSNQSYIFPIDGNVTLGHQISENSMRPPVLKNGTVYVADKRILAEDYYQNTPFELRMGDRFIVRDAQTQASGFIFVDHQGDIDISYRVKGREGVVQKYKSEPIIVENNFWSKLVNDDLLAIFWLFIWALFGIIKSLLFLKYDVIKVGRNNE